MPTFEITFRDGTKVRKDGPNGDAAKQAVKHSRLLETGANDPSDARILVTSVTEINAEQLAAEKNREAQQAQPVNGVAQGARE